MTEIGNGDCRLLSPASTKRHVREARIPSRQVTTAMPHRGQSRVSRRYRSRSLVGPEVFVHEPDMLIQKLSIFRRVRPGEAAM